MVSKSAALLIAIAMASASLPAGIPAAPPAVTLAATSAADPYTGLGTWVSIFMDTWDRPIHHVQQMHDRGVRTLYLQTSSSSTPANTRIFRPDRVGMFIEAAHRRGMKVVAWYLPPLRGSSEEYERAMAAIRFRSLNGHRFDAFALDIEPSSGAPDVPERNTNLLRLSRRINNSVSDRYQLGAIIPSPVGMRRVPAYWPQFPYEELGRIYDVIVPMSYSTYRVSGPSDTYDYHRRNIYILRSILGRQVRISMIGGEANQSDRLETRAFISAVNDAGVAGASMWHYGSHTRADWEELRRLHRE